MFWVKKTFIDESTRFKAWILELSDIIDKRMMVDPQWNTEKIKKEMDDIESKSRDLAKKMKTSDTDKRKEGRFSNGTISVLLALFIIGGLVLLFSFVGK